MPGTAMRILNLNNDPNADTAKLAEIIEMDPLLTAQIIRWSTSSLYGYRGKVTTVYDAITRVLGFNFVLDLALGLSVLAPLKSPKEGPIGTYVFWIHALCSTRFMKHLFDRMPDKSPLNQQEVFLAGLMHNIGFPLLGHQFPDEFARLCALIQANPSLSIFNLETFSFGVNHSETGAWLMNAWSMPRSITNVIYHHHNPYYRGENHHLNLLTFLSDCLLSKIDIGDAKNQNCPDEVWEVLGLEETGCQEILDKLNEDLDKISEMAEMLIS